MNRKAIVLVLVALAAAPAFAKSGPKSGGANPPPTPPAAQTRDEEAVAFLLNLDNSKFKLSDEESIANIRKMLGFWRDSTVSSGAKSKIAKLLLWFGQRKSSPVVLAAVAALGDMGKGAGASKLVTLLDGLMLQKDPPADQVAGVLGALRNAADPDPDVTRAVMKVLVEKDGPTAARAADVFASYADTPAETRRRLFSELLINSETIAAAAAKPENQPAVDKWKALAFPAAAALGSLSKQSFADVAAARKWFNEKGRDPTLWK